jgi:hypothetical protein
LDLSFKEKIIDGTDFIISEEFQEAVRNFSEEKINEQGLLPLVM